MGMKPIAFETVEELECLSNFTNSEKIGFIFKYSPMTENQVPGPLISITGPAQRKRVARDSGRGVRDSPRHLFRTT